MSTILTTPTKSGLRTSKKEVMFMGTKAFNKFLISIQGHIGSLNTKVSV